MTKLVRFFSSLPLSPSSLFSFLSIDNDSIVDRMDSRNRRFGSKEFSELEARKI